MTPDEVKSLNILAMAHGGQLTINPHTGLPEAGFLSAILPMLAGAALGPAGLGLFESAGMAGLGVGALTGLATGSLSKGLMAGMGAYGGAGLGEALAQTGMEQATQAELAKNQAFQAQQQAAQQQAADLGKLAQEQVKSGTFNEQIFRDQAQGITSPLNQMRASTATNVAANSGFGGPDFVTSTTGNRLDTTLQGLKSLGSEAGRSSFMGNIGGGMGLAKYGLAAAAPVISDINKPKPQAPMQTDSNPGQQYNYTLGTLKGPYTADTSGREQQYFNQQYIPRYADGGMVEPGTPTKYSYDPMGQLFAKIESIPSDDQNKQKAEMQAQRQGGVHTPMTDAQFAAQKAQGEANMNGFNSFGDTVSNGILSFLSQPPLSVQLLQSLLGPSGLAFGIGSMPGAPGTGVGYGGTAASGSSNMGFTNNAPTGQTPANSGSGESGMNAGGGGRGGGGGGGGGNSSGIGIGVGGVNGSAGTATSTSSGNAAAAKGGLMATGHLRPPHAFFQNGKYSFHPAQMYAEGGVPNDGYNLGGYSDGGRLLRGPGDGVSDSIPATIGHKQPARLADGEFVVPARIVSELGNGSTEAGARKLYAMMDRVQSARSKTVGKGKIAANSKSEKYLPA